MKQFSLDVFYKVNTMEQLFHAQALMLQQSAIPYHISLRCKKRTADRGKGSQRCLHILWLSLALAAVSQI